MRHESESLLDVSEKASQLSPFSEDCRANRLLSVLIFQEECLLGTLLFFGLIGKYSRSGCMKDKVFRKKRNRENNMDIGGFQKLSLLNYPGKAACTVFTSGCNFRCPWCHNSGLVREETPAIDPEEIFSYLRKRKGLLENVCISGGEPMMNDDLLSFLRELKHLGYAVKIDTNGSFPERLEQIISEKCAGYIAMDVKNTPAKYAGTIGLTDAPLDRILQSVSLLKQGRIEYEFRTTIIAEYHNAEDITQIASRLKGAGIWYLQPFQDSPEVPQKGLHAPDKKTIEEFGSIGNRYLKTVIRK